MRGAVALTHSKPWIQASHFLSKAWHKQKRSVNPLFARARVPVPDGWFHLLILSWEHGREGNNGVEKSLDAAIPYLTHHRL